MTKKLKNEKSRKILKNAENTPFEKQREIKNVILSDKGKRDKK